MPIRTRPKSAFPVSDTATSFDVTLATPATPEDLVTVPSGDKGRIVSLVNGGPGSVALAFDATATVADFLLEEGDAYDEHDLEISTKISFINVTPTVSPRVRGILWSGV
jgi:hypothetical protein